MRGNWNLTPIVLRHPPDVAVELEDEFVRGLKQSFEEKIVFNSVIGLKIDSLRAERVIGRIAMKRELVGTTPSTAAVRCGFALLRVRQPWLPAFAGKTD